MLKRSWLQVNDVFVLVFAGIRRGEGARMNVFRNPYIVNEIKVIDDYNKSNIQYDISSYCYIV
jgi:hypothetical protein